MSNAARMFLKSAGQRMRECEKFTRHLERSYETKYRTIILCHPITHFRCIKTYCSSSSTYSGGEHCDTNVDRNIDDVIPEIYTDGCCYGNGTSKARAGIGVYWGSGDGRNVSEPLAGRPTNNRAEIHAAIRAITQCKEQGIEEVIIKTDSQFLIKSVTQWIHKWRENGWSLSNGQPVINKDDFKELDKVLGGIDITWIHVRGHKGVTGNVEADKLAHEGAKKTVLQ